MQVVPGTLVPQFNIVETTLHDCGSKHEINAVWVEFKPFKAAYVDLLAMAKPANNRLGQVIRSTLADIDAQAASYQKREATMLGSQRRRSMPQEGALFDAAATHCTAIASILVAGGKPWPRTA